MSNIASGGNFNLDGNASLLRSNMVGKHDKQTAIAEEKAKSQVDGNNNIIVVEDIGENSVISNLKVDSKVPLESFALGREIKFGAISGTIHFLDSSEDDNAVTEVKNKGTAGFDPKNLSALQATKFIIASNAGSGELEDLRENEYSDNELTDILKAYQEDFGLQPSGKWDEKTFAKAKEEFIDQYGEFISDAQFSAIIKDMLHCYDGKLSHKEVQENLDGYFYDNFKAPVHEPFEIDTKGFNDFMSTISKEDLFKTVMTVNIFDKKEIDMMMFIGQHHNDPKLAEKFQKSFNLDKEEAEESIADMKYEFGKVPDFDDLLSFAVKELKSSFLDKSDLTGSFDAEIYSKLIYNFKDEYNIDKPVSELKAEFKEYLNDCVLYASGKLSEADFDAKTYK